MQRFLGLLGAAGATLVLFAACGGKVVVESSGATSSGSGGAGGSGDASTTSMIFDGPFSAVAVGVTSGGQVGSTGVTTGSGMSCSSCAKVVMDPTASTDDLCPEAASLYMDLFGCVCAGACATQCSANVCIGQTVSGECTSCVSNVDNGCGSQLDKCLAN